MRGSGEGPRRPQAFKATSAERAFSSRNEALEFARRARHNLEFIVQAAGRGDDVHVVTQLTLSLLGMVVFPREKLLLEAIKETPLSSLAKEGWPSWTITRDDSAQPTRTLGDILKHVRNAVAHGRITFTSDSRLMHEVRLLVEDCKGGSSRFLAHIDDTIG